LGSVHKDATAAKLGRENFGTCKASSKSTPNHLVIILFEKRKTRIPKPECKGIQGDRSATGERVGD